MYCFIYLQEYLNTIINDLQYEELHKIINDMLISYLSTNNTKIQYYGSYGYQIAEYLGLFSDNSKFIIPANIVKVIQEFKGWNLIKQYEISI